MDRWKTLQVKCRGGLNVNEDPLAYDPGEATALVNMEPSIHGGYRRISGFTEYDTAEVPGTGKVLGVCVHTYSGGVSGVLAAREDDVYFGTGGGWGSSIATRTNAGKYHFTKYSMGGERRVIMCDGVNPAARFDGTTYTLINGASSPTNPKFACEFKSVVFYGGHTDDTVICTAPNTDNDFDAVDGAFEFNLGDTPVGMHVYRDQLIIFCENSIYKITGNTVFDFKLDPITRNIGCLARDSIQEINTDLVFLSPDGIRTVAGTERIGDTELGNISKKIQPIISLAADTAADMDNISSLVIRNKSQYRMFYPSTSGPEADALGVLSVFTQHKGINPSWEWAETLGIKPSCADSGYIGDEEVVLHGGFDGYVYQQEIGTNFNGSAISNVYRTAPLFFDDPAHRKTLYKLTTFRRDEGTCESTVAVVLDYEDPDVIQPTAIALEGSNTISVYGSAVYGTSTYGGNRNPRLPINILGSGKTIQLVYSTNDATSQPYSIQSFFIQYGLEGRR